MPRPIRKAAPLSVECLEDRRVPSTLAVPPSLLRALQELNSHAAHVRVDVLLRVLSPSAIVSPSVSVETEVVEASIHGGPNQDDPGEEHSEHLQVVSEAVEVRVGAGKWNRLTADRIDREIIHRSVTEEAKPLLRASGPEVPPSAPEATEGRGTPRMLRSISAPDLTNVQRPATPADVVAAAAPNVPAEARSTRATSVSADLGAGVLESNARTDEHEATRHRPAATTAAPTGVLRTLPTARSQVAAEEPLLLDLRPNILAAPVNDDAHLGLAIQQFLEQLDDLGREVARALSSHGWWAWVAASALGAAGLEMMRRRLRRRTAFAAVGADDDVSLTSVPGLPGPFSSEQP